MSLAVQTPRPAPTDAGRPARAGAYRPRRCPATWPQTEQSREIVLARLLAPPFRADSRSARKFRERGLPALLDWLEMQPGATWQDRWLASGAEQAGRDWVDLVVRAVPTLTERRPAVVRNELLSGMRLLIIGQVLRPGYGWLLRCRYKYLLDDARRLLDPQGFARLRDHCDATRRTNPVDRQCAFNRIAWIVVAKGGLIRDITVGDCLELDAAQAEHHSGYASRRPLFYALLLETGVLATDAPPSLLAATALGQRSPTELVDCYAIRSASVRELLVAYLTERAGELDYGSLVHLANAVCGLFWQDLERHHPGIDSLHLPAEVATAWKQRLRQVRDADGHVLRDRSSVHSQLLLVRAFYLDIAQWAAEDPARWSRWVAPCPIKAAECSMDKERKHRKAAMDQRTRVRLPMLPALVRTAESEHTLARIRLNQALDTAPGEVFESGSERFRRRPTMAGRVYVTDLITRQRRDLTFEENRAFWAWASIEVLRHTGIRIEEMLELTHHSFVAYKLPSTGEIVPMLQVVPSKTDSERLLLVSPELGEVLAEVIHRVRGGRAALSLVLGYDVHERTWSPPMPFLFQRPHGPRHRTLSRGTIRRYLNHTLAVSGLTDATGQPLRFTPHDFRRLFATDALRSGLPPHIAAKILGHVDLGTTMGYAAIYPEDVISHHRAFIARRRALRPGEEYRDLTPDEWDQFIHHFELRKVALGVCTRDFATPCVHEHSCVRCPLLRPDPGQMPRLTEIRDNLQARIAEAEREGWLGEIAGLEATLAAAEQKLDTMRLLASRHGNTHLGMPDFRLDMGRSDASS